MRRDASGSKMLPRTVMPGILGRCNNSFVTVMFHRQDSMANSIILYILHASLDVYNW